MKQQHSQVRLSFLEQSPDLVKLLSSVSMALAASSEVEATLLHLVDIRASQINGCGLCLDMHVKQAKIAGERELRLHHVAVWRESQLFTPRERAALAWTEALTRLEPAGVSDDLYAEVREQFSEKAMSVLTFVVITINAWNRINIAFLTPPGSQDQAFGLEKAGLA